MMNKDVLLRKYILDYDIEVPEHLIENELNYIMLEMRHRMQYDTLTGGGLHLFPQAELDAQKEEFYQAAYYEAKYDLVMKAIITEQNFTVTREDLDAEAVAMAERQNTTVDMIKTFFGENLSMLERDVKERKALDWIYIQASRC